MSIFNSLMRALVDALLFPFRSHELIGLLVVSLIAGVGMLLIFKATSNQTGLEAVKRKIHACLFEIRLFNDDFRAILRAQGEILKHNLGYLKLSMVPMVWIIPPLFLLVAQLHFHYGYRGLQPGEEAVVTVTLADGVAGEGTELPATLEAPAGVSIETPGVWAPSLNEVSWRIEAVDEGRYELGITVDGETHVKELEIGNRIVRTSPTRDEGTFLNQLIYPAEAALPKGGTIRQISVDYPDAEVDLLGWKTHWMIAFFILSIVFVFVLRKPLGVQV